MNDRATDVAQPPAPADPRAGTPTVHDQRSTGEGGIKETIESIVVAFIFAFIFRGFVVEAFVIPTGSMAPTLMGAHMRFHCPDCGYHFEVNYQNESGNAEDLNIPRFAIVQDTQTGRIYNRVYAIYCPNCGYKLPRLDPDEPQNDVTAPPVRYGDRILVLKYLYLFSEPERWDVVVFKAPAEPDRYDYTQNYIKRLVGKPGERIFILDGDIYVGAPAAPAGEFVVQTKPPKVQDALWRIVADNDYLPRGLGEWQQPWKTNSGETGWDTSARDFNFNNLNAQATLWFDPEANPNNRALTDWLAYDMAAYNPHRQADTYHLPSYVPDNNVSDVKLSFYYRRSAGDGPLELLLTKLDDEFTATITPDSASVRRFNRSTGATTIIAENIPLRSTGNRARQIEFMNVDYRITLRIDGRDVIQTTPQQYSPDIPMLLKAALVPERPLPKPRIEITAHQQSCTLSHLSLWRDVYYMNREVTGAKQPVPWGSPHDFPERVIDLGADEYFVLGDNSMISGDARMWRDDIELPAERLFVESGRVPGRFMIGKAFFVYWPAGYRPMPAAPALVPNFGDMRFIH